MTTASVTTDINIGPFKIPSNVQNMVMNFYAHRNQIPIEIVIPEPIMSNKLATTIWLHKEFYFKRIILSSAHQLPKDEIDFDALVNVLKNVEFHFVMEGLKGAGLEFLNSVYEEVKIFDRCKFIDSRNYSWLELYELNKKL